MDFFLKNYQWRVLNGMFSGYGLWGALVFDSNEIDLIKITVASDV